MCVKCWMNGELSSGRKEFLAVHGSHPTGMKKQPFFHFVWKGGFYVYSCLLEKSFPSNQEHPCIGFMLHFYGNAGDVFKCLCTSLRKSENLFQLHLYSLVFVHWRTCHGSDFRILCRYHFLHAVSIRRFLFWLYIICHAGSFHFRSVFMGYKNHSHQACVFTSNHYRIH